MRKLLLGLLPLACTVSSADTQPQQRIAAPNNQPIIEKGSGCGVDQEIAADGDVRPRPSPRSSKGAVDKLDHEGGAEDARAPSRPSPAPSADAPATTTRGAAVGGRPGAPPPPPSRIATTGISPRPPMEQPSGVRAGEWDDNANYRDYVKWLASSTTRGRIDITGRQFIVVTDTAGKPMPNVSLTINGSNGTSAKLVTMASGRAIVFPTAFGLRGDLTATATYGGKTTTARLATTVDGVIKIELPTQRAVIAKRRVDLAFVLDTTGSMAEEIDAVKQTIKAVSDQLSNAQTDVRIGLVEYKDRSDCLLTRTFPFSNDLRAFSASVANISASGGGDLPEDLHKGLDASLDKLQWRGDATRMVVVIADAPPQFYAQSNDYANAAKRAATRGIKLYTVAASGMDNLGQVVMRQMSQVTGGSNMFVLRGGAGPQSVGGGDPKSSCGGTHQDFSSGKLDQLIMRKVRQELASLDADPMKIPGRGQDENAKPCEQRLVVAN